jgi:hypothetical protein
VTRLTAAAALSISVRRWLVLAVVAVGNGVLLWLFYDRYWYPVDEGNYAHIAERLLAGDILHLNIQDLHPGYINFLNALAFWIFGFDLISFRYPLVFVSLLEACLVYVFISRRDVLLAAVGSFAMIGLGVIQFLNPTAHWYCLFLSVTLVCWLAWTPPGSVVRTIGAGVFLGLITLFRQLTGVWVGMAVLVFLLLEQSTTAQGRQTVFARALLGLMLTALLGYLVLAGGPTSGGILLMGSWPIAILCIAITTIGTTNSATTQLLTRLTFGAAAAALPLVLYHLVNGSFGAWIDDVVVASMALTQLDFFEGGWFSLLSIAGLHQALNSTDPRTIANGVYWGVLPLIPAANGILLLRRLSSGQPVGALALPVVAAFYALVSLHLEGPVYLYYAIGLPLAAVLWMVATAARWKRVLLASGTALITLVAVLFHAGQSFSRTSTQVLQGRQTFTASTPICPPFERSTLKVERADCDAYQQLVAAVQRETSGQDYIFAVPSDAELYFLADRPNPFRFYNTALGVRTERELNEVLQTLIDRPPRVITFRTDDKYNTAASRRIMEYVRSAYEKFDTVGQVQLYRSRTSRIKERAEGRW